MSKTIYAEHNGRRALLALWPDNRTGGRFDELQGIIKGASTELRTHWLSSEMTANNRDLSDHGKRAKRSESAQDKMRSLGKMAHQLTQIRRAAESEAASLAKLPPLDNPARAVVLVELAKIMRSMPAGDLATRLLSGASPDFVEAALQLPAELTGIRPEFRAKVLEAHIERSNPAEAATARDMAQAVDAAENALRRAWQEIAPDAGIDLAEQVSAFEGDTEAAQAIMTNTNARTIERLVERESDPDAHRLMPTE
jgi:hypothetical protein